MSISHILLGNSNPLNVEFNNVKIDGTVNIPVITPTTINSVSINNSGLISTSTLNVSGSSTMSAINSSGNILTTAAIQDVGPNPSLTIRNNGSNSNNATITMNGNNGVVGDFKIFQNNLGNVTFQNLTSGGAVNFIQTGSTNADSEFFINGFPVTPSTQGAVTQTTSITTDVTYNGTSVRLTTFGSTILPQGIVTFNLLSNGITVDNIVQATVVNSSITGFPLVYLTSQNTGSIIVNICNAHATQSITGQLIIAFSFS
jgi:hypothetical protein